MVKEKFRLRETKRRKISIFQNKAVLLALLGIILLLLVIFLKKVTVFLILGGIGGYLKYIRIRTRMPIIFEPIFFFCIIIAQKMSFMSAILFIFSANLIPEILSMDVTQFTFTWIVQLSMYSFIATLLKGQTIVATGIILIIADMILSPIIHFFGGDRFELFTIAPISYLIFNLIYFLSFGQFIANIIG